MAPSPANMPARIEPPPSCVHASPCPPRPLDWRAWLCHRSLSQSQEEAHTSLSVWAESRGVGGWTLGAVEAGPINRHPLGLPGGPRCPGSQSVFLLGVLGCVSLPSSWGSATTTSGKLSAPWSGRSLRSLSPGHPCGFRRL